MNEETLVPKLRFSGFDDDWKKVTLKDIIEKIIDFRGKTPKKIGLKWGGNIPALSAINVKMGKIEFNDETHYGNEELYNKWMTNGDCEKNDIVMTMEAPMGNIAQIPDNNKYILSQRVILLKLINNVNNDFIYSYLKSFKFQNQLNKYATGSTAKGIKQKNLVKTNVYLPTFEEQGKIAGFLKNIELKIELLEKKYENYQNFKKYLMQQIFAQKLRFNCNDEWKKNKLNEISVLTSSKRIYSSDYVKDGVPFYRGAEITQLNNNEEIKEKLFISTEKYNELKNKFGAPKKDDILVTGVGTLGNVYKIKDNTEFYFKDGNLIWIKDIKINPDYLELYLKRYKNEILKLSIGSTQKALTIESLEKLNVKYPSLEEQKNIVNFISSVNGKIYSIEKTLKNVKKFKKGLLQQMFV